MIVEWRHGARAKKPEADSYGPEAERICHGLVDALKLWPAMGSDLTHRAKLISGFGDRADSLGLTGRLLVIAISCH